MLSLNEESSSCLIGSLASFLKIPEIGILTIQRCLIRQIIAVLCSKVFMRQTQLLIDQFTKESYATHSVCQGMEDFQIDSLLVIGHMKEIGAIEVGMNQTAGVL